MLQINMVREIYNTLPDSLSQLSKLCMYIYMATYINMSVDLNNHVVRLNADAGIIADNVTLNTTVDDIINDGIFVNGPPDINNHNISATPAINHHISLNQTADDDDASLNVRLLKLEDLTAFQNKSINYLLDANALLKKKLGDAEEEINQLQNYSQGNCVNDTSDDQELNADELKDISCNKKGKLIKTKTKPIIVKFTSYRNIKLIFDAKKNPRVVQNEVKRKIGTFQKEK